METFQKYITPLLDLIFPPKCKTCLKLSENLICASCLQDFKPVLFQPVKIKHINNFLALFEYSGAIKQALHVIKFENNKKLAEFMSKIILNHLIGIADAFNYHKYDAIISVPISKNKKQSRGFNQVDLLLVEFINYFSLPQRMNILLRVKDTKPQFTLDKAQRMLNIQDSFMLGQEVEIKGKNILLIDDIYTTGATMEECAKVLLRSGAANVDGMCFTQVLLNK